MAKAYKLLHYYGSNRSIQSSTGFTSRTVFVFFIVDYFKPFPHDLLQLFHSCNTIKFSCLKWNFNDNLTCVCQIQKMEHGFLECIKSRNLFCNTEMTYKVVKFIGRYVCPSWENLSFQKKNVIIVKKMRIAKKGGLRNSSRTNITLKIITSDGHGRTFMSGIKAQYSELLTYIVYDMNIVYTLNLQHLISSTIDRFFSYSMSTISIESDSLRKWKF